MLPEIIYQLRPKKEEIYCDLTFGDGGYTKAILDHCNCKVVAVDQDPIAYENAVKLSQVEQYKGRLFPILGKFGSIQDHCADLFGENIPCFDGIVMDIGVSSGQLETAERGFSYKIDGPLDMRMFSRGRNSEKEPVYENEIMLMKKSISVYEIVNYFSREQITKIIFDNSGDRTSQKIANAIVKARESGPIESTSALAAVIQEECPQPGWLRGSDGVVRNSAARTFQAFRIHVNDELNELRYALAASEYLLKPGGRLAVVTFHSLEDKIVKNFIQHCAGQRDLLNSKDHQFKMKRAARKNYQKSIKNGDLEATPKRSVYRPENSAPSYKIMNKKVIKPSSEEINENVRSRSAKLRLALRTTEKPVNPYSL